MAGLKIDRKSFTPTPSFLTGFTLVEIMIVLMIIAVIASLSLPHIHRARINANEQSAISGLKTLHTAIETYGEIYNNTYPANLNLLANDPAPFIPPILVTACNGTGGPPEYYYGYQFCYNRTSPTAYNCTANPYTANVTGTRTFRVTKSGVIEEQSGAIWVPLE